MVHVPTGTVRDARPGQPERASAAAVHRFQTGRRRTREEVLVGIVQQFAHRLAAHRLAAHAAEVQSVQPM